MRIAVIGVGGVGGYISGMLASHLPEVSVVARGERGRSIKEKGLVLHSGYKGEIIAHPANVAGGVKELGEQDLIFICVKNYSLEQVLSDLKDTVTENTILVPVMNGVDPGDRIRSAFPQCAVVDSVIYIVSFSNPDYSVTQQGKFASMRIGAADMSETVQNAVKTVQSVLTEADIDAKTAADIQTAVWRKYILNCAYNVCTAAYDRTIGELRDDPGTAAEYEACVRESCLVAEAKGINIGEGYAQEQIDSFYNKQAADATSSLQRDVRAGRQAEIETFSGYIVKEAQRLGLTVPVSEKLYAMLTSAGR